jgi:hypothetical protein
VLRRRSFVLPYEDQVPVLAALTRSGIEPRVQPEDPERLVEAAVYHRMAGYLARAVERGEVRLDAALRSRLSRIGAIQIVHSNVLRRELVAVEPVLARACGAPPVCVKGPAIADRFYTDPRLRPFNDLDLLVPGDRLDRAAASLVERGYEPLHEFRPGFGQRHGHDLHLARRIGDRAVDVELHWRIGDDPACAALDYGSMASRATRTHIDGVAVSVPAVGERGSSDRPSNRGAS